MKLSDIKVGTVCAYFEKPTDENYTPVEVVSIHPNFVYVADRDKTRTKIEITQNAYHGAFLIGLVHPDKLHVKKLMGIEELIAFRQNEM